MTALSREAYVASLERMQAAMHRLYLGADDRVDSDIAYRMHRCFEDEITVLKNEDPT